MRIIFFRISLEWPYIFAAYLNVICYIDNYFRTFKIHAMNTEIHKHQIIV